MDHETTIPLLSDLLAGRLAADRSGEAWGHVGSCLECRSVAAAMSEVRQAAAGRRGAAAGDHPPAEDLVDYALEDGELVGASRARVEDHLRSCPSCLSDVQLTREADRGVPSRTGRPRLGERLFWPAPAWAAVLAAVAVVGGLGLPAYQGRVALDESRQARQDLARQVETLQDQHRALQGALKAREEALSQLQQGGGAVPLLYLGGTARGASGLPSVVLREGQLFQPIVLDPELVTVAPDREVVLSLRRLPEGTEAWSHRAAWGQLRDADSRALTLLVPVRVLSPGEYRLELRQQGRPRPLYSAVFSVRPPARRP